MIGTILGLIVAFWLVALLIAAVADHPWLLLLPLLAVLGIAVLAFSGDRHGSAQPVAQADAQDSPEAQRERALQYVIARYGEAHVRTCYDAEKARDGTERGFWTCVEARKPQSAR